MSKAVPIGEQPRGEDFTYKFRKSEWAESLLLKTLNTHDELLPIQYGVSRDDTLYTKAELDAVKESNVNEMKRPDILVFHEADITNTPNISRDELKRYHTASPDKRKEILTEIESKNLLNTARMAIEVEASRFNVSKRSNSRSSLSAYVKCEDYPRLANWQRTADETPLYVCQMFFDSAFIVPFSAVEKHAEKTSRTHPNPAPGFTIGEIPGIGKKGYKISLDEYLAAIKLGEFEEDPDVVKEQENELQQVEFSWYSNGQLCSEVTDPHFHGGELTASAKDSLARFALTN